MIMNAYLVRKYSYTPAQRRRTTMVLDGQRMGDERDWVLVGFFVTCSSSAEKRFIRPAKQDEMGLCCVASPSLLLRRADVEPRDVMMRCSRLPNKQLACKCPQTALNGVNVLKLFYRI